METCPVGFCALTVADHVERTLHQAQFFHAIAVDASLKIFFKLMFPWGQLGLVASHWTFQNPSA
jgi:hypothetical protein